MTEQQHDPAPWRGRWVLYAGGVALLVLGLHGIVANTNGWENPPYWAALFLAGAVGHDLVIAPVVFGVAAVLMRLASSRVRAVVASALIVSAVLLLLALPGIRAAGRSADNPTILPLHYGQGLIVLLTALWTSVALVGLARALRQSRRP